MAREALFVPLVHIEKARNCMTQKSITRNKALRMAIEALESQRHAVAVDANLHDVYGADYPAAVSASKKRTEIEQAIEIIKAISIQLS
jgi:hypothetical protein